MLLDKNNRPRLNITESYNLWDEEIEEYELEDVETVYQYQLFDEEGEEIEEYFFHTSLESIKDQLPEEWKSQDMAKYLEQN